VGARGAAADLRSLCLERAMKRLEVRGEVASFVERGAYRRRAGGPARDGAVTSSSWSCGEVSSHGTHTPRG